MLWATSSDAVTPTRTPDLSDRAVARSETRQHPRCTRQHSQGVPTREGSSHSFPAPHPFAPPPSLITAPPPPPTPQL